jgi:fucose permease
MATKTSILIFYLRMSKNTQKILRLASYATLVVVNVAGVVLTFMNAFQCSPIKAAYDPTETADRCISIVTLYLCSAPVNIITDLAILVLPIPVLTGMRLPQRQKTILVITFALGIFVAIVDVVRIYYLQQAADVQSMSLSKAKLGSGVDFSFNASTALMWSAVEVNVGIICACIPTLKPLIKRILPAMLTDHSGNTYGTEKTASSSSQVQHPELNTAQPHRLDSIAESVPGIQPLPPAQLGGDQEREMDMMDFLTTPGMEPGTMDRTQTSHTAVTDNTVYFGFVNMRRPKSMLKTKGWESFKYCAIVTLLFFLWGFSYGLLNTLNGVISAIADETISQNLGLESAYFGAYIFGSLTVGQWVLRKGGFKATFITGLCIYGTGTLMFWPSAVLTSFPGFIISTFVVGFGLSVLETAANPFLALCGPSDKAEFRLLLAQAVQATASVLSQLLAEKVLFDSITTNPSLIDVQWTYLAVTLFTVMLALFFYYMPLPEATDIELEQLSENLGIYPSQTIFSYKLPFIYTTLALAVFAQFLYVGAQEGNSVWAGGLVAELTPASGLTISSDDYYLVAHTAFALGRFFFAPLCLYIPPRILLLVTFIGALIFSILIVSLDLNANGISGLVTMFQFFEGPAWPIIYAIGLRGLGRNTKQGAAYITAGASGGAAFPFVMWAVQQVDHKSVQYSYAVIIALFSFGMLFPIYLNFVPMARHQVDPAKEASLPHTEERRESDANRPATPIEKFSRRFSVIFSKINPGKGGKTGSQEVGIVEHRERGSLGSNQTGRAR